MPTISSRACRTDSTTGTVPPMEIGYARVSTTRQYLERQIHVLE